MSSAQSTAIVAASTVQQEAQLVRADDADFMPLMSIDRAVERRNTLVEFAKRIMVRGVDYGTIPGTERKNTDGTPSNSSDTLLKPGAEKLCTLFGLVPAYEDYRVVEDWDKGIFYYAFRCVLLRHARYEVLGGQRVLVGTAIGSAIGSANSREKKYRRVQRVCPECNAPAIKRSKYPPRNQPNASPGWYCFDKAGGCGANFDADDSRILEQAAVADPMEAADQINTLQKMAQKRSLVAAALIGTNASEFFSQDVGDMELIDAEWRATDAGPTAGNIDGKSDTDIFLELWDAIVDGYGLDVRMGRQFIGLIAGKLKVPVARLGEHFVPLDVPGGTALLNAFKDAKPEQVAKLIEIVERQEKPAEQTPPTAAAPATAPTEQPAFADAQDDGLPGSVDVPPIQKKQTKKAG